MRCRILLTLVLALIGAACTGDEAVTADPPPSTASTSAAPPTSAAPTTAVPTTVAPTTSVEPTTTTLAARPAIDWDECAVDRLPRADTRCGTLAVPANRSDPDGPSIDLQVIVVPATGVDTVGDPVVYLSGGPGDPAIRLAENAFDLVFGPFNDRRDVVVFDQRGTGYSEPDTRCPEVTAANGALLAASGDRGSFIDDVYAAVAECRDRLVAGGTDLEGFDTTASASDLEDLRIALGYETWNLYGISYGTRLAIDVLRDHPNGVRAAILDSVLPPQVDLTGTRIVNLERGLGLVFDTCAAHERCGARYGDLETRFWDLVGTLDTSPLEVQTRVDGLPRTVTFDGDTFIAATFFALYVPDLTANLPAMIDRVAGGDGRALAPYASLLLGFAANPGTGVGMTNSVICRDEVPFAGEPSIAEHPILARAAAATEALSPQDQCELWFAGASEPIENQPVATDVPVLALAGEFDPVTPPMWAREAVVDLDPSFVVQFAGLGHAVTIGRDCPIGIALDFLDDPTAAPDTSCAAAFGPPDYLIRP